MMQGKFYFAIIFFEGLAVFFFLNNLLELFILVLIIIYPSKLSLIFNQKIVTNTSINFH